MTSSSGHSLLNDPYGFLDYAVGLVGLRADVVLRRRETEEQHTGDAQLSDGAYLRHQVVEGEVEDAGHRVDLPPHVPAMRDEYRVHEVAHGQPGLLGQPPERR